jgi:hypothetical protein
MENCDKRELQMERRERIKNVRDCMYKDKEGIWRVYLEN